MKKEINALLKSVKRDMKTMKSEKPTSNFSQGVKVGWLSVLTKYEGILEKMKNE